MRKVLILASLLMLTGMGMSKADSLDDRMREADRALQQYDEQVRQKAQYDADLAQLRARYEEELAHQRAVTYLDPYGVDHER